MYLRVYYKSILINVLNVLNQDIILYLYPLIKLIATSASKEVSCAKLI